MVDNIITNEHSASEVWEPTHLLRWYKKEIHLDAMHAQMITVLQQKWRDLTFGKEEWKDVPTESE